jgi:hypothetical protein
MFEVLKRGKVHNLSIQCQLDLFDKIIKPILLYGCEVWGFLKNEIIERVFKTSNIALWLSLLELFLPLQSSQILKVKHPDN